MSISLVAIKFNHDPTDFKSDALNISKDGKELVTAPEWKSGGSINHEDSTAAYAINETRGNKILIKAKFRSDSPLSVPVEIRAIELNENLPIDEDGAPLLARLIRPAVRRLMRGPLGNVGARAVSFNNNGETDFVDFELPNVRLQERGVGVSNITWGWQYRAGRDSWTTFCKSRHRIYTLLSRPQQPWELEPSNGSPLHLPWIGVLNLACQWADGARTPPDVATRITRSLYQLGPGVVTYKAAPSYILVETANFLCATFLFHLNMRKVTLNCTDCAMVVSTFANALGCNLSQSRMTGFTTNPILLIGRTMSTLETFNILHEVAWEGAANVDDDVYDACLQVDGDENPTTDFDFRNPLLPADIRFGRDSERFYRFRLVAPRNPHGAGRPVPSTSRRRSLSVQLVQRERLVGTESFRAAARAFDFKSWGEDESRSNKQSKNLFFWRVAANARIPPDWHPLRVERYKTGEKTTFEKTTFLDTHLLMSEEQDEMVVRVSIFEGDSLIDAREWLVEFLASLHSFEGVTRGPDNLGEVSFILGESRDVIFARANLAVAVRNVGSENRLLTGVARQIERAFIGQSHLDELIQMPRMKLFEFADKEEFVNGDIPLRMNEANPPAGLSLVYKFISKTGSVYAQNEQLFYHPIAEEQQTLSVFAVNLSGNAFRQDLSSP